MAAVVFVASFLVLAFVGFLNAGYLLWKHYRNQPLVCPLTHDCSKVTESPFAQLLPIRNEVLGTVFYARKCVGLKPRASTHFRHPENSPPEESVRSNHAL